jgi:glycosyltransferase involved in cell wall biosynthesis
LGDSALGSPKISVALCTFNGEQYLKEQLVSILNQSLAPFELIISDDNSTDSTLDLIEQYCEAAAFPVTILSNRSNLGIKANFEQAISVCTGDYVALADQDDVWSREKLEVFSRAIVAADLSCPTLFFSDLTLIDSSGRPTGHTFLSKAGVSPPAKEHYNLLAVGNFSPGCSIVFDRKLVSSILPIPEGAILHDWWINLIFSMCGKIERVPVTTMCYRIHASNNQGISTKARSLDIGRQKGFVSTARANLLATLDQVECARRRLTETGERYPVVMDQLVDAFNHNNMLRPLLLLRLGIRRGNGFKTAVTLIASVFIDRSKIGDNTSRYT